MSTLRRLTFFSPCFTAGDPLVGFNKPFQSLVAINIKDSERQTLLDTKQWLREYVIPRVTTARDVLEFRQVFRLMRERMKGAKPKSIMQVSSKHILLVVLCTDVQHICAQEKFTA